VLAQDISVLLQDEKIALLCPIFKLPNKSLYWRSDSSSKQSEPGGVGNKMLKNDKIAAYNDLATVVLYGGDGEGEIH